MRRGRRSSGGFALASPDRSAKEAVIRPCVDPPGERLFQIVRQLVENFESGPERHFGNRRPLHAFAVLPVIEFDRRLPQHRRAVSVSAISRDEP